MLDRTEESGGRINWPAAVVLSVLLHAALLGAVLLASSSAAPDAPAPAAEAPAAAPASAAPATPPAPTPAPGATAATAAPTDDPPAGPAADEAVVAYTVVSGDYPGRIATRHGCTLADLRRLNGAAIDKTLHPGQVIKVPAKPRTP